VAKRENVLLHLLLVSLRMGPCSVLLRFYYPECCHSVWPLECSLSLPHECTHTEGDWHPIDPDVEGFNQLTLFNSLRSRHLGGCCHWSLATSMLAHSDAWLVHGIGSVLSIHEYSLRYKYRIQMRIYVFSQVAPLPQYTRTM